MICEYCNLKHDGTYGSGRFCNKKCARGFSTKEKRKEINKKVSKKLSKTTVKKVFKKRNKYIQKFCIYCGKAIGKRAKYFCNYKCQTEYNYLLWINRWKLGVETGIRGSTGTNKKLRKYFFIKYNNKCQKCGWKKLNPTTEKIPLELHHKDGNFKNNKEENLELLCPNCHSLTNTYKSINKNKGRPKKF